MRRIAVLACLLGLLPQAGAAEPAKFEVVYRESNDCSVKGEWTRELERVLPEFRSLWSANGPAMFAAAASLTNRSLDRYVEPVRLTLCDAPSQSFGGPSVNMRFALRSFTASPVPLRYKVDIAFHESLHGFVAEHAPRDSRLLAAHRSEPACVLNHVHLLALQKAVLLALGDAAALAQLIAIDSQLPSGCYRRAWSLVNETGERYKQYVAELSGGT